METYSGTSVLDPGTPTGKIETVGRLLSPLAASEVGTIRCIGLNVSLRPPLGHEESLIGTVCPTCQRS